MAARLNPTQDERARSAIQTTQLIKRLQRFVFEEPGDMGEVVEIDPTKLRAIEILLRKSLPDLSSVALSTPDGPLQVEDVKATAKLAAFLSDRKKSG